MAVTAKVDITKVREKLAALQKGLPDASLESLKAVFGGNGVMGYVVGKCPVDTGRLLESWSQASRGAGLPPPPGGWPMPGIKASKYTEKYRQRLAEQLVSLEARAAWVVGRDSSWQTRKGVRTGGMRPSAVKYLNRIEKAIEKTREDLANLGETDILMKSRDGRLRQFSTRSKVYGGWGRSYMVGWIALVTVKSLEPHANTVEKMHRSFATAMAVMKAAGLRRYGKPVLLRAMKKYAPDVVKAA